MTGPIEIELWVSSSARDTDFVARLVDVHPDGKAYNLMSPTLEVLRARYRNGEDRPEPLEPGQPVKLRLANGITVERVQGRPPRRALVTSSLHPHLDRNPNTGGVIATEAADATGGAACPATTPAHVSRVVLPVVPR